QDAELFIVCAPDASSLESQIQHLLTIAPRLSRAEMSDLAALLANSVTHSQVRAAVVAATPSELVERLNILRAWLINGTRSNIDPRAGAFFGQGDLRPRIGFLFPGQGSPMHRSGGAWCRRFPFIDELYAGANLPENDDAISTAMAQPAIVTACLAA